MHLPNDIQAMNSQVIRVATRKSPLAVWQANWVSQQLAGQRIVCELVLLSSLGDADLRPITSTTEVGLFTKRIQQALLQGEADVAVHSLKDLPTAHFENLHVAAIPPRAEVQDRLISNHDYTLSTLPHGAVVGTSSRRRAAQLLYHRPDLQIQPIRGNVQTRLEQVRSGAFDATILASAGLERLAIEDVGGTLLSLDDMLPAPGQGALAIETRIDDARTSQIVATLDDRDTRAAVTAERSLLKHLSGGCLAPIAAYGRTSGNELSLTAVVLSVDGTVRLQRDAAGQIDDATELGIRVADMLLSAGADRWIEAAR